MSQPVTTTIDPDLCIGCGSCVEVCPSDTITLEGDVAQVTGDHSLICGHCSAVCPERAITVGGLDPAASSFETFDLDTSWLPHGAGDTAALVRLMGSRRSCRNYKEEPVDRRVLDDLIKVGAMAPSGTNSQGSFFTVLPNRRAVLALGERVKSFFKLLNSISEQPAVRGASRLLPGPDLDAYFRDHHDKIQEVIEEYEQGVRERLFHGAPAVIVVGSKPDASTPGEDALLAAQNILLAAHTMGLGTCLIGFAVAASGVDPRIRKTLGMAKGEKVRAVIAVGHPAESYERICGRKTIDVRFFQG